MQQKELVYSLISTSVNETEACGMQFARQLSSGDFIAMYGDLGAGKTAFIRGLCRVIVPDIETSSPTYSVVNEYSSNGMTIYHMDAYRISSDDDLESIGFYDYLKEGICIAEWCENIKDQLPEDRYDVFFEKISENERRIAVIRVKEAEE